jgi:hypothetical protein
METAGLEPIGGSGRANYRKRQAVRGIVDGQSGAVTVIQRANSDLRLSPHRTDVGRKGAQTIRNPVRFAYAHTMKPLCFQAFQKLRFLVPRSSI